MASVTSRSSQQIRSIVVGLGYEETGMKDDHIDIIVDGWTTPIVQPFTAREVLRIGGLMGDGLVIRIDGGRASRFAPDRPVAFEGAAVRPVFRTFRGAVHRLRVDGLLWEWGAPAISATDVRAIAGIEADWPIRIEGVDGTLRQCALIDITSELPPRLRTSPVLQTLSGSGD